MDWLPVVWQLICISGGFSEWMSVRHPWDTASGTRGTKQARSDWRLDKLKEMRKEGADWPTWISLRHADWTNIWQLECHHQSWIFIPFSAERTSYFSRFHIDPRPFSTHSHRPWNFGASVDRVRHPGRLPVAEPGDDSRRNQWNKWEKMEAKWKRKRRRRRGRKLVIDIDWVLGRIPADALHSINDQFRNSGMTELPPLIATRRAIESIASALLFCLLFHHFHLLLSDFLSVWVDVFFYFYGLFPLIHFNRIDLAPHCQ